MSFTAICDIKAFSQELTWHYIFPSDIQRRDSGIAKEASANHEAGEATDSKPIAPPAVPAPAGMANDSKHFIAELASETEGKPTIVPEMPAAATAAGATIASSEGGKDFFFGINELRV